MASGSTPLPAIDPVVVLVDASPLIHLAAAGQLDLTLRFGPVIVPDAVEIEATWDDKPWASEIGSWLEAHRRTAGVNRWVERPATDIGELLRLAAEMGRARPRNAGEHAIVNWLSDHASTFGGPALVVYENGRVPNMLMREGLAEDVIVVTTRALLDLAEEAGYLPDAKATWDQIVAAAPHANPTASYQLIRGTK